MKERIIEIIKELKEVKETEKLDISDDNLFSESISTYRGEQASLNRPCFRNEIPKSKTEPATEKQKYFIHKNNIDANTENLSKAEATQIIKKFKEQHDKEI